MALQQYGVPKIIHAKQSEIEPLLTELVSLALGERVVCTFQAPAALTASGDLINVRCTTGVSVGFSLSTLIGIRPLNAAIARVRLSQALNIRGQNFATVTDSDADHANGSVGLFLVMGESGEKRGIILARWIGEIGSSAQSSHSRKVLPSLMVKASLHGVPKSEAESAGKGLRLTTGVNGAVWKVRVLEGQGQWYRFECMELFMEPNITLVSSISLGNLEIPLGDILALRPGSIIEFEAPPNFLAVLKVTEREWARGELTWNGRKATFKVSQAPAGSENSGDVVPGDSTARQEIIAA